MAASVNGLLGRLQAALAGEPDKVPKGWHTREEWAVKLGRSTSQTDRMLAAGVKVGLMERREFRIRIKSGVVRSTPHWREKRR